MRLKEIIPAILLSAFFTLLIFVLHIGRPDSLLSEKSLTEMVNYHKNDPIFMRRPLTSWLVDTFAAMCNLGTARAFVLVNFGLLFFNGIWLYLLAGLFHPNGRRQTFVVLLYYLCAPVLFSFYQPVYSYDEPLQYFFILGSIYFLVRKKWQWFILFYSLALIARESSLLLLPGLFLYRDKSRLWSMLCIYFAPLVIYGAVLWCLINHYHIAAISKADTFSRFDYFFLNFSNNDRSLETAFAFIITLGLPLALLWVLRKYHRLENTLMNTSLRGFWFCLFLNTIVVISTTQAREFRLMALPLLLIWPALGSWWLQTIQEALSVKALLRHLTNIRSGGLLLAGTVVNYLISFRLYRTTIGNVGDNYFNLYLFVYLSVILLLLLNKTKKAVNANGHSL